MLRMTLTFAASFVVSFAVVWLLAGFVAMEFDATKWHPLLRFVYVCVSSLLSIPIAGFALDAQEAA